MYVCKYRHETTHKNEMENGGSEDSRKSEQIFDTKIDENSCIIIYVTMKPP